MSPDLKSIHTMSAISPTPKLWTPHNTRSYLPSARRKWFGARSSKTTLATASIQAKSLTLCSSRIATNPSKLFQTTCPTRESRRLTPSLFTQRFSSLPTLTLPTLACSVEPSTVFYASLILHKQPQRLLRPLPASE